MFDNIDNIVKYIKTDFASHPVRFIVEVFAWACSVISAILFAITVPNVPFVPLYTLYISGCCAAGWACYSRKSFGLLINYAFLIVIDGAGLLKILW